MRSGALSWTGERVIDVAYGTSAAWWINAVGGPLVSRAGLLYDRAGTWTTLTPPAGAADQPDPAVWAGDSLLVLGGLDGARAHRIPTVWHFHPQP